MPGQAVVAENYVYDGDQLVAVMNATGAIQHQYFDGSSLDQVFADPTVLSDVLWPLEDRTRAARDVISTAGVVLEHRKIDSFGKITSQTGPTVDYDQFFSGLSWDADSQLYYARARWYDPIGGKFIGEDPLRFGAGDTNLSRYGANDPVNNTDPSGLSWFSQALKQVGNAFEDVGHFVEKQWDNGNIQKGLLVAGTLASGGMLGLGLATGSMAGMGLATGSLGFASGAVNSFEVFSGNQIGNGTFSRFLGAAAAVSGGFYGATQFSGIGRGLSGASGLISGYEIASGNYIGDGTLSSLFHVTNLGVNHGSTLFNANASAAQRFGVGLNLAVGGASVASTGDRGLQQALRSLSIANGIWNTGTQAVTAYQTSKATLEALRPTPIQVRAQSQIRQVGHEQVIDHETTGSDDEVFDIVVPRGLLNTKEHGTLENNSWFGSEDVGRIVSFGRINPEDPYSLPKSSGQRWVSRTVIGQDGQPTTYYAPLDIVRYHNDLWDTPDNWDVWFSNQGYTSADQSELTPLSTVTTHPETGATVYSNRMTVRAETFYNNVDGQEYGERYYSNVGLVADRELRTHFVEPESGLIIRPKRNLMGPTIEAGADSNRIRPHQIQEATGVPEIDNWNMLLRKGQYAEFAFGQSGFGQHTLFVAGGAYSIPKAQGQAINALVRSTNQPRAQVTIQQGPTVIARARVGNSTFMDTNQEGRSVMAANPYERTLIGDYISEKSAKSGRLLPNGNMADAHAEIGVIHQAFKAGNTQGAAMIMDVWGREVCGFCTGNVAIAAETALLKSLVINDVSRGKSFNWTPGMRNLGLPK